MAAARLGAKTGLLTLNQRMIAQMSCNPSVGGIAKGHLVREIDALGGVMAGVADRTGIQFRLLNRSRGPAVQAPRAQCDKELYRADMQRLLAGQANLTVEEAEAASIIQQKGRLVAIETTTGRRIDCGRPLVLLGHVEMDEQCLATRGTNTGGRLLTDRIVDISDNDGRAFSGEHACGCTADAHHSAFDAVSAAGYEGDFIF